MPGRETPPMEVAPGVHRMGDEAVNFYLVRSDEGLILIDAGLPAHLGQLRDYLVSIGHDLEDIRAVLLTHAHPDHTGLAAPLHGAGSAVLVHAEDAPILRDGPRSTFRHAKPERSLARYLLRRPAALAIPLHVARKGGFTARPVAGATAFAADQRLESVPGRPMALSLPGHTPGSTAFHFPERSLLFTGDALVAADRIVGHIGPCLVPRGFTHDGAAALAALDRIDQLPYETLLLPGHGAPIAGPPTEATRLARQFGVR
ncbi:MBL fold metallo-hydrolase [Streptomyces profundus]|uniref:MBL fold metallo-hydrolase n=1 Tax=Streptomyces profundus TaxID=2867410 RepID=UPI001D163398|nr:MBL fold metallo-hydrolase [Streptomyces sp. MA3_2.13]UED87266.1 MBL fold metallo-hydrolase [Streptomyces sp. MA3_2.13]